MISSTSRRAFLGAMGMGAVSANAVLAFGARAQSIAAELSRVAGEPDEIARDESYWARVQQAFTVDRSVINFNNGGVSPAPQWVQEAMKQHLDFSNRLPPHHLWQIQEPRKETVRERLARAWGVDAEEIALTRNASESLQICQLGIDLKSGDEVLTTTQDYGRMLTTFNQRERREGIKLTKIAIPVPAESDDEVVRLFEEAITPNTRVILMCHVINLTGQILPVRRVCDMAAKHNIPVIVDGAHSFAHVDFKLSDLNCDYFGTSLHKWLFAPHGTGLLYVKKSRIAETWPMMPAAETQTDDIRKFEEIGTHPAANTLAIAEALTFHEGIGSARKLARMVFLRDRWAKRLAGQDRFRLNTSLKPGVAGGIANVAIEGIDTGKLQGWLWGEHKILTVTIKHEQFEGIRVSPSVYSTIEEVDRFAELMERAAKDGIE
ncbi:MAG: aminotransferase class V-fold PLP-dependent enzyme [Phycisphaerales bacterium]|nr:aminotransferase class V-fold PLP-dependent enzyme [Phycisphaerales bacterium]MCB9837401.1 aminotransferase class V-fold PLP-dependent enzyme [Phycisphaera sp.]